MNYMGRWIFIVPNSLRESTRHPNQLPTQTQSLPARFESHTRSQRMPHSVNTVSQLNQNVCIAGSAPRLASRSSVTTMFVAPLCLLIVLCVHSCDGKQTLCENFFQPDVRIMYLCVFGCTIIGSFVRIDCFANRVQVGCEGRPIVKRGFRCVVENCALAGAGRAGCTPYQVSLIPRGSGDQDPSA